MLAGAPVLLAVIVGALWFTGVLPNLLGGSHSKTPAAERAEKLQAPAYVELPEMVANLNAGGRHPIYVKLRAKLEISKAEDEPAVRAAMPRLLDLFQTYLREMRPEELRGSAGTYRLREELIARADIAAAPARIQNVLFIEMLIQ